MEKYGIVSPGTTPPENPNEKVAADLSSNTAKRLADAVAEKLKQEATQPKSN